ncbi:MAG: hypothetical protein B6241_03130 [Spirochaetaceae bacterium 4572_59]|nr:MAG: hypothetical protein B6241_03130 [Spirochaetaceae bacterium 4572_59]
MSRAFFLSLLLHIFIFIMMIFLIQPKLMEESYPLLSISFSKIEVPEAPDTIKLPHEIVPEVQNLVFEEQAVIPDSTETEALITDKMEFQESPTVEQSGQDEMIKNTSAGSEPLENNITAEVIPVSGNFDPEIVLPPPLNITWSGGIARKLLRGEKPSPDISRNTLLMDQLSISFSVYPDGTVFNVRIAPPGSNSFQVDRQLREWASLLLFEASDSDVSSTEGQIHITLTVRETP